MVEVSGSCPDQRREIARALGPYKLRALWCLSYRDHVLAREGSLFSERTIGPENPLGGS